MKDYKTGEGFYIDTVFVSILIFLYSFVSVIAFWKIFLCINFPKSENTLRLLWFYFIIACVCFCKGYIVRSAWCLNLFFEYSYDTFYLLDSLIAASLSTLGLTFCLFWMQILIQVNYEYSEVRKRRLILVWFSVYFIIILTLFTIHILLVYYSLIDSDQKSLQLYLNALIALIVSILLTIVGSFLTKRITVVLSGIIGTKIKKRINLIIAASGVIYLIESILSIIENVCNLDIEGTVSNFIVSLIFLAGTEIIPLSSVLYFLNPTLLRKNTISSSIPSGLLSESHSNSRICEVALTFMTESNFSELSGNNDVRRSTSLPNIAYREKIGNKSLFQTLAIN